MVEFRLVEAKRWCPSIVIIPIKRLLFSKPCMNIIFSSPSSGCLGFLEFVISYHHHLSLVHWLVMSVKMTSAVNGAQISCLFFVVMIKLNLTRYEILIIHQKLMPTCSTCCLKRSCSKLKLLLHCLRLDALTCLLSSYPRRNIRQRCRTFCTGKWNKHQ